MTASGNDESERKQNFGLRWATSTPRERRAMMHGEMRRTDPQTTRNAYVLVGLVFMAAAIAGLIKAIAVGGTALNIGLFAAGIVLGGAMAELSRRGRTRLGFTVLVVGMIGLGLAETMPH
jgi:hypothetical protein